MCVCWARRRGRRSEACVCVQRSSDRRKRRADLAAWRGRRYFSVRLNVGRSASADGARTRSPSDKRARLPSVLVFPSFAPCNGGRWPRPRSSADVRNSQIDSLFCLFQYSVSTFSFRISRSVLLLCRTYRGRARTQRGSGSEGSCVMRFKLIPRRSETLPLPPLLGHAVLMAAVPLLAHTMQTHSLSLSLRRGCCFFFFLPFYYIKKKIRWSFKVAAALRSASLLCAALCIIQHLYSGVDRSELHAWLQARTLQGFGALRPV